MERNNNIPVFYYHSVAPARNKSWYKSFLTFELSHFQDLLKYLVSRGYRFLDLDEYFEMRNDPAAAGKKLICLTFDDGYLDNYVYIFPVLKKNNAKGTIFISPFWVQENEQPRPTLFDVWSGKIKDKDLESSGFVSWKEMEYMISSGVISIQSHTLTHTKYYCSDIIREFHHLKADWLYPIGNRFPERLPYYITDKEFINLLPLGTPFFQEKSAIICKRVFINEDFEKECAQTLRGYNWDHYDYTDCFSLIKSLYEDYKRGNNLIVREESDEEYLLRIKHEISGSKSILESRLGCRINHICWPHGDYNDMCHRLAIESGYRSSHMVLKRGETNNHPDRFDRTGSGMIPFSRAVSLVKAVYKLESYRQKRPFIWIKRVYEAGRVKK